MKTSRATIAAMVAGALQMILLAFAPHAAAEVIDTPVNVRLSGNGSIKINLNHDGITDFVLVSASHVVGCGNWHGLIGSTKIIPTAGDGVVVSNGNFAAIMASGISIDASATFHKAPAVVAQFFICGSGDRDVAGYLGLEFQINGQTHYGWAQVNIFAEYRGLYQYHTTLTGFAYETIPGQAIKTGQTSGNFDDARSIPESIHPSSSEKTTPVAASVSAGIRATIPASSHVFLLVEENHSYSSVVGNSSMPYFNGLAKRYGLATQYYANTHASIGNYFMLTTGQVITNDNSLCKTLTQDNMVRHLLTAGKTWKAYADSLPASGYTGCGAYPYAKRHDPFAYFSDVANSSEKYNLVPFTKFASDLAHHTLPNFSFIVPNLLHDAHDGSLTTADSWLKTNIAPLINSATFQKDGILIIVFDESLDSDTQHGGGHVAAVVIGPKVKPGYKSATLYQHQNTLKTLMEALGLTTFPGAAGSAPSMADFF